MLFSLINFKNHVGHISSWPLKVFEQISYKLADADASVTRQGVVPKTLWKKSRQCLSELDFSEDGFSIQKNLSLLLWLKLPK